MSPRWSPNSCREKFTTLNCSLTLLRVTSALINLRRRTRCLAPAFTSFKLILILAQLMVPFRALRPIRKSSPCKQNYRTSWRTSLLLEIDSNALTSWTIRSATGLSASITNSETSPKTPFSNKNLRILSKFSTPWLTVLLTNSARLLKTNKILLKLLELETTSMMSTLNLTTKNTDSAMSAWDLNLDSPMLMKLAMVVRVMSPELEAAVKAQKRLRPIKTN